MKRITFILVGIATILLMVFLFNVINKTGETYYGYIPENEYPTIFFDSTRYGFEVKGVIPVILDDSTQIPGSFFPGKMMWGSNLIEYKNLFPPSKGKKVFVKISYKDDIYEIIQADLGPFHKEHQKFVKRWELIKKKPF